MTSGVGNEVTEDPTLASVASAVRFIELSTLYQSATTPRLGSGLAPLAALYQPADLTTSIRAYELNDVVLDADTLMLLHAGRPIPETAFLLPPDAAETLRPWPERQVRQDASEDIIIGCNKYHAQYLSWLTQCLPSMDWLLRKPRPRPARLVLPPLLPWQEECLALLGHRSLPRLVPEAGRQYFLPHADYAEFVNGGAYGVSTSLLETAHRMGDRVPLRGPPRRMLYVHCQQTYYGTISNAAEVRQMLAASGIWVVEQDRGNVADRINLFRQADVVIGAHCGELSDVLFCKPGALVWEWTASHCASPVVNWFAQAGRLDYWGELLEPDAEREGCLRFDLARLQRGLSEISQYLANRSVQPVATRVDTRPAKATQEKPIDELMLAFESLGDNCEFGLVQRHARAEPLGLLRFASIRASDPVAGLVDALRAEFDGLGDPGTLIVEPSGSDGQREYVVHDLRYHIHYHSGVREADMAPEALRQRQAKRLTFLRRKLLEDLRSAAKIWVWKSLPQMAPEQLQPLRDVLRGFGPNVLMWVVEAGPGQPAGSVERLADDFIKATVERFAPYDNANDIAPLPWIQVCRTVYGLYHPDEPRPERLFDIAPAAPAPLSAMDYLARHAASAEAMPTDAGGKGLFRAMRRLVGLGAGR